MFIKVKDKETKGETGTISFQAAASLTYKFFLCKSYVHFYPWYTVTKYFQNEGFWGGKCNFLFCKGVKGSFYSSNFFCKTIKKNVGRRYYFYPGITLTKL